MHRGYDFRQLATTKGLVNVYSAHGASADDNV